MDSAHEATSLSIKRDTTPEIQVHTGERLSWPVRWSVQLPSRREAIVSWVVPASKIRCVACGRTEEIV
jgi:hypothetical protein